MPSVSVFQKTLDFLRNMEYNIITQMMIIAKLRGIDI